MRSYSFDLNITPQTKESPIKELVILEEFKWSSYIMIFLIFNFFLFSLYFNFYSILVNIVISLNFLHIIYKLYQIKLISQQSDDSGQELPNNSLNNHRDFSYNFLLIILCFILGCLEVLIILAINSNIFINNQSGRSNKPSIKNFELTFSYMKLLFIITKNLYLAFIYYYFKDIRIRITSD
jgi:hypothetical protein